MEGEHNHHAYVFDILHDLLLIMSILLQSFPDMGEGPLVTCIEVVLSVELKLDILILFIQRVVSQMDEYLIEIVLVRWTVLLSANP